jgi:predicted dehydrogenase
MSLTLGMIGLKHQHTAGHLRTFEALDAVSRVVLCHPGDAAAALPAGDFAKVGGDPVDLDHLLAREDIPVVCVTLPNDITPEIVARCARAGKHVLCEKPCARSAAEMRPAQAELKRQGRQFCVFYIWRANPAVLQMRHLVRSGAIGRLTSVELRMVTTQVGMRNPSHWLFRRDMAGGGILSWLGCHWLDLMRYVTGREVESVAALVGTVSGEAIDVEDVAGVTMRLNGGALATLHAGYLLPSGRPGYENAGYDMGITFRGTTGTLSHSGYGDEQTVTLESIAPGWHTAPRQVYRYTLPRQSTYGGAHGLEFVERFIEEATTGSGPGPAPVSEAVRVLEVLDAIYLSAEREQVVRLPA